ncbi:unnamed protein product [Somion occarium]|uniref:Uncharacterized protein n=1 Tax=Somion occarium TaxID=3059160 RepID=A0ABP1D505_9APHY
MHGSETNVSKCRANGGRSVAIVMPSFGALGLKTREEGSWTQENFRKDRQVDPITMNRSRKFSALVRNGRPWLRDSSTSSPGACSNRKKLVIIGSGPHTNSSHSRQVKAISEISAWQWCPIRGGGGRIGQMANAASLDWTCDPSERTGFPYTTTRRFRRETRAIAAVASAGIGSTLPNVLCPHVILGNRLLLAECPHGILYSATSSELDLGMVVVLL